MSHIFHVVSFKLDPSTQPPLTSAFLALPSQCRRSDGTTYIFSIRGGKQSSVEGKHQDMDLVFLLAFENQEDLDYYVNHDPVHQEFKRRAGQEWGIKGAIVLDFVEGQF